MTRTLSFALVLVLALGAVQVLGACSSPPRLSLALPNGLLAPYYALNALQNATSPKIVVFYVHGTNRNGDEYFCGMQDSWAQYAAKTRRALSEVLVVAPQFFIVNDTGLNNRTDVYWCDSLLEHVFTIGA